MIMEMRSKSRRMVALGAAIGLTAGMLAATSVPVLAQTKEIRISYQFGLGFLPITVAVEQQLIEKHAAELGAADVKVSSVQLSGAAITNDALLAGNIELAAGGIGGLLQLWDKTNGSVKGVVALNDMALLLNTNDPNIKMIKDYLGVSGHKIALPAVKVGAHAIVLQMAAEQAFGKGRQYDLDNLTVSLPHPDGHAALLSGRSDVRSHFTSLPFSYLQLQSKEPPIHNVLSSYDVLGEPHNNTLLYARERWVKENPVLLQAVFDAIVEAHRWIGANPEEAAKLYKDRSKSPISLSDLTAMIQNKKLMGYGPEPLATMKFAEFFHSIGRIKTKPASWKDYFWDVAHRLNGS